MLSVRPLATRPLLSAPAGVPRLTLDILQEVVTDFVREKLLTTAPAKLHHFTSLEAAYRIIEDDDVRLSHAEYSNDQMEMEEAKRIIMSRLGVRSSTFFAQVQREYRRAAPRLDAFVFCMSRGRRDKLSQWRAYGQDGRGICMTLDGLELSRRVNNTPGLRINPVIYRRATQRRFIDAILDQAARRVGEPNARDAAVAALVYATPLMKHRGFREEREWRLIFMPPAGIAPHLNFYPRRDFLAPFITLRDIWFTLRPIMRAIPDLAAMLPTPLPAGHVPPLIPITKIMLGPSGHQSLNRRAARNLIAQTPHRASVRILRSKIPYRSLG